MFGRSRLKKKQIHATQQRRKIFQTILIWFFIVTPVVLIGYGLWCLVHAPFFNIQNTEVVGGETVSHQTIIETVNKELEGDYYHLVPKRFAFFYPEEKILEKVREIPRIKEINLERTDARTVHISFTEYEPYALWCGHVATGVFTNCFFIDSEGVAFAKAPELSGSALLRYVEEGQEPELRKQIFTHTWLKLGEEFSVGIGKRFGFAVKYLERVNENEVFVHLSGGGLLKIGGEQSVDETLEDLEAIFTNQQFSSLRSGNFVHVDLRYGDKVFVKEKEVMATSTTEVETIPGQ